MSLLQRDAALVLWSDHRLFLREVSAGATQSPTKKISKQIGVLKVLNGQFCFTNFLVCGHIPVPSNATQIQCVLSRLVNGEHKQLGQPKEIQVALLPGKGIS